MGKPKKDKRGECESCGDVLQLRLSNGMQVCGKCSTIYSNTRNWLPIVEASLVYFYPERYGVEALSNPDAVVVKGIVDDKTEALFKRMAKAIGYAGNDPEFFAEYVEDCSGQFDRLNADRDKLMNQVEIEKRRGDDLEKSYEELSQSYDDYRSKFLMDNSPVQVRPPLKDKHLLDLAKVFLKNPNAGCDEVADWIDVVREAA